MSFLILLSLSWAQTGDPYVFTLDGEPCRPWILSLNATPEAPEPGDVAMIGGIFLTLGTQRKCDFEFDPSNPGRLMLVLPEGRRQVVGVDVTTRFRKDVSEVINPLKGLSPDEIRGLWGLRLDAWDENIESQFAHSDPQRACLIVEMGAVVADKLPPFADQFRYLIIGLHSSTSTFRAPDLQRQFQLRLLWLGMGDLDGPSLSRCHELRYLRATQMSNPQTLPPLKSLTYLNLRWVEIEDLSFVKAMPRLRHLDIGSSKVTDLGALAGHGSIVEVEANFSKIKALPGDAIPSLKRLSVMSTKLTPDQVATFARANPGCEVRHGWNDMLRKATKGLTKLVVLKQVLNQQNQFEVQEVFQSIDEKEISEFIGLIEVSESSQGRCMCMGGPTLVFHRGKEPAPALTLQHGLAIRWSEWPGDGVLTEKSSSQMYEWLTKRGISIQMDMIAHRKKVEEAERRVRERLTQVLGEELVTAIPSAGSKEERVQVLRNTSKSPADVIRRAFCLYGQQGHEWCRTTWWDEVPGVVLQGATKEELDQALKEALKNAHELPGAARRLFGDRLWKEIDPKTIESVLPAVAAVGLDDPKRLNRRQTISALCDIGSPTAMKILQAVLDGESGCKPVPNSDGHDLAYGHRVIEEDRLEGTVSERAFTALILAKAGQRQFLVTIRSAAAKASDSDRSVLDEAVKLLTPGDKPPVQK